MSPTVVRCGSTNRNPRPVSAKAIARDMACQVLPDPVAPTVQSTNASVAPPHGTPTNRSRPFSDTTPIGISRLGEWGLNVSRSGGSGNLRPDTLAIFSGGGASSVCMESQCHTGRSRSTTPRSQIWSNKPLGIFANHQLVVIG